MPGPRVERPGSRPIRVLHVDDDSGLLGLSKAVLERERDRFEVTTATDVPTGLERLAEGSFDAVVSDYDMPGCNGVAFLRAVRERYGELPFVLFTGKGSEEVAEEAIAAGVTDYIQKEGNVDHYRVLANRVANGVEQYRVRRENERLRAYTEHASDVVTVLAPDGTIRYQSPSVADVLGYDPSAMVGENAFGYVHPEDRDRVVAAFERSMADPEREPVVTYRFRDADDGWLTVESRGANRTEDDTVGGFVVNSRDVTDRERLAAEYERTLHRMTDAFLAVDEQWRLTVLNEAARRALCTVVGEDRLADDLRGAELWSLVPAAVGTEFETRYREAMATQSSVTFETPVPPLEARLEVRAYPSESGLSVYFRDVTERHEREARLAAQRERLEQLGTFVSSGAFVGDGSQPAH